MRTDQKKEVRLIIMVKMNSDSDLISEQEARFELRESFLQAVMNLKGTPCKILTYEQSTLEATFAEWNPDGSEMLVTDLKTPANIRMTSALLRTPDIISVHFNNSIPIHEISSS